MKRLLTTILLLCCIDVIVAQEFRFDRLPTQDQLPVANVHRVFQDNDGYMWYATEGGGICRDDGYRVDVIRSDRNHPDVLASNNITCICESADGKIWFGTQSGCYVIDKRDYSVSLLPETRGMRVSDAYCRSNGEMLVAVQGKILCFSSSKKFIRSYTKGISSGDAYVNNMVEDSTGNLYVAISKVGFYRLDDSSGSFSDLHWPYDYFPNYIVSDSIRGGLWIGTWGMGVARYRNGRYLSLTSTLGEGNVGLFRNEILNIVLDKNRSLLWVVTMEDIYAYKINGDELCMMDLSAYIPSGKKIIDNAFLDRRGNLWVPGYSPHTFILSSVDGKINRDGVGAMTDRTGYRVMADRIFRSDAECYWIWQGRVGLSLYNTSTNQIVFAGEQAYPAPYGGSKSALCPSGDGGLWSATDNRVCLLNHDGMTVRWEEKGQSKGNVNEILPYSKSLFLATSEGIERMSLPDYHVESVLDTDTPVYHLVILPDRTMFYTTSNALFCKRFQSDCVELRRDDFTSLCVGGDFTVWASTSGGSVYKIEYRPSSSDLSLDLSVGATNRNGDSVKDIEADSIGHIWILSDQYLKEYNPQTDGSRIIRNTDKDVDMDYFHTIEVQDGEVLVGGIGAFCNVSPSTSLDMPQLPICPTVTSYIIDGENHMCGSSVVEIPKDSKETVLCLSSFDHLHTQQIRLSYRLSADEEWTDLDFGQNKVYLRNLEQGDYTLYVRATDEYGRWSDGSECIHIKQLGSWWKSACFKWMLWVLFSALLLFVIVKYRKRFSKAAKILAPRRLSLAFGSRKHLEEIRQKQEMKEKADREFLERAVDIVKTHLDDSDFGVEQLSSALFMTRMNLYRKIQGITGTTPSEFIRLQRLEYAANLLLTTYLSVSEVSDRTGFGTPRQFSRCFKQKYGMLPKDFRKHNAGSLQA